MLMLLRGWARSGSEVFEVRGSSDVSYALLVAMTSLAVVAAAVGSR